ncbi:hypothetical protein D3C85_1684800 [compost metagenome]
MALPIVIENVLIPEAVAEEFEKTTSLIAATKSEYKTAAPVGLDSVSFPATASQLVIMVECEAGFESSSLSRPLE